LIGAFSVCVPPQGNVHLFVANEIVVNVCFWVMWTYFLAVIVFLNAEKRFYANYFRFFEPIG